MSEIIYQIFDKTFKKILTLSSKAVINMINGLFDTDYPFDSTITYNWTEFENDKLKRVLADTIVTVSANGESHSYHMEAQVERDNDIVFRVFEYSLNHALRTRDARKDPYVLNFPRPIIIYLYHEQKIPEQYDLTINFGEQGTFCYHVPALDLIRLSVEEMNEKKLVILLPFQLLKLRALIKQERSEENKQALIHLIQNDIMGSIKKNLEVGNITRDDARKLYSYTQLLYQYIYARYEELEDVSSMTDESFMTEVDILCEEKEQLQQEIEARDAEIAKRDSQIAEKDSEIAEKDSEIAVLKKQVADLQNQSTKQE
jgi:hypothetical protein